MEQIDIQLRSIREKQRISFWAIVVVGILVAVGTCLIIYLANRNRGAGSGRAAQLERHNEALVKQNETLMGTVDSLGGAISVLKSNDSLLIALSEANARAMPGLDRKINEIYKKYEIYISRARSLSTTELESYIAAEADRIRKSNGQR